MRVLAGQAPEHVPHSTRASSGDAAPPLSAYLPLAPLLTSSHRYFCQVFSGESCAADTSHTLQKFTNSNKTQVHHPLYMGVKAGGQDRNRVRARWKAHMAQLLTLPTIPQTVQGPAEPREPHKH